jgi:tetratricopeptide (TPR) repeat protein
VDALPEGAKELLQVGSLIEREFSYRLIKAAMHLPEEDLLRRLSVLKDAELLYERGLFPDSTFVFKHALTREVVYETLLERKKKDLHVDIGQAIEEVYKENLEEMYGALADHFEQGGDYEKAAQYFLLAQERSRRTSTFTEAIAFSKKAVACLEKLPTTIEVQKRVIDARVALANNCMRLNHYVEARDAVDPVVDLVHQLDYRKSLPTIYCVKAAYLYNFEERYVDEARHYLMEAQKLALEEKDYLSLVYAYLHEGIAHNFDNEFAEAESCFLRMMEMSEAAGNVQGLVIAKVNIAGICVRGGRIDAALKCGQEAFQLALQADDLYLKGAAYGACGNAFFRKGLFPEAEENLTLAIEINQKTDFILILISCFSGLLSLHFEMGRYQEAQECCDAALAVLERVRLSPSFARVAQIQKVLAGVRGRLDLALDAVLNFDLQEIRLRGAQGVAAHTIGEIYLYIDDGHMDEAEAWIKKAVEADERNRMPWELATDYALYAEFFKKRADPAQAKEKLGKAIELMRGCGADGWVKKYEEELAAIS